MCISSKSQNILVLPAQEPLFKAEGTDSKGTEAGKSLWVQGLERSLAWLEGKQQETRVVGRGHTLQGVWTGTHT